MEIQCPEEILEISQTATSANKKPKPRPESIWIKAMVQYWLYIALDDVLEILLMGNDVTACSCTISKNDAINPHSIKLKQVTGQLKKLVLGYIDLQLVPTQTILVVINVVKATPHPFFVVNQRTREDYSVLVFFINTIICSLGQLLTQRGPFLKGMRACVKGKVNCRPNQNTCLTNCYASSIR